MSFESVCTNGSVNGFKGAEEALVLYKLVDSAKTLISVGFGERFFLILFSRQ